MTKRAGLLVGIQSGKPSYKVYKHYGISVNGKFVTNVNFIGLTSDVESFSVATGDISNDLARAWGTDSIALAEEVLRQIENIMSEREVPAKVELFDTWKNGLAEWGDKK